MDIQKHKQFISWVIIALLLFGAGFVTGWLSSGKAMIMINSPIYNGTGGDQIID